MLSFASDYQEGAHPKILQRLAETNLLRSPGYGTDEYCARARDKIKAACGAPDAAVYFLSGGTQTNLTVLDSLLASFEGVLAADTGHVSGHEAGAVELTGHKVLTVPHVRGKLTAAAAEGFLKRFYADDNREHMVQPGAMYISQPTEYGTLYSLAELTALREVCNAYGLKLFADGARLAYALGSEKNDVTLKDLARLTDVFYIGGTKCGALLGEAVVIPDPTLLPRFFTQMKQHGALLAKGRLLGIQFDELFRDDLYLKIGEGAIKAAERIRQALRSKGYRLCFDSPTNQIFCIMDNDALKKLEERVEYSYWGKYDEGHTVIRFATDWAITEGETDALIDVL